MLSIFENKFHPQMRILALSNNMAGAVNTLVVKHRSCR